MTKQKPPTLWDWGLEERGDEVKPRKERIPIGELFIIDYYVLFDLRHRERKYPFMLTPLSRTDYELVLAGKLKLKEGSRVIEIKEFWKKGIDKQ